ncbi:MAG: hypothetical protein ACOH2A_10130 [Sphingobacteriaceae bacterium]
MRVYPVSKWSVLLLLLSLPEFLSAQSVYQVGSAESSIEPPGSIFSLTLAGYGAPREGRFSLEWVAQEDKQANSGSGLKQQLYLSCLKPVPNMALTCFSLMKSK